MISFHSRFFLLAVAMTLMTFGYLATNYWSDVRNPYNVYTSIEATLPFVPSGVYIYIFVYLSLLASPIFLVVKKKDFQLLIIQVGLISAFSCLIFIIFPTTTWRPIPEGDGLTSTLLQYLFLIDSPNNCCPSLHVSLAALFGYFLHTKKYWRIYPLIIAASVIISTVLIKQHCLVDVIGGLLIVIITWCGYFFLKQQYKQKGNQ